MDEDRVKMGVGPKIIMFAIFVAVWLAAGFALTHVVDGFEKGGWGMWPILAVGLVSIMVMLDRVRYLFFVAPMKRDVFQAQVQKHLMDGDVASALAFCQQNERPLSKVVGAGLSQVHRSNQEVQEAVDEAALRELPRIEVRTGYLAMIGNISTLLGLLGTIIGLIKAFAGVSLSNPNDPATMARARQYIQLVPSCKHAKGKVLVKCIGQNKATILAAGISEAMNCTAFGLGVGIFSLLGFSVLNGRTQSMLDDISDTTVYLLNVAVANRKVLKLS